MLSLYDRATIAAALRQPLAPDLRQLITGLLAQAETAGLLELTHLLVVQAGDTEAAIIREVALSPLVNPIDGIRYGEPNFLPFWDWLQVHPGWYEMTVCIGNSGFAFILLIDRAAGTLPELLRVCAEFGYAGEGGSPCA